MWSYVESVNGVKIAISFYGQCYAFSTSNQSLLGVSAKCTEFLNAGGEWRWAVRTRYHVSIHPKSISHQISPLMLSKTINFTFWTFKGQLDYV